MTENWSSPPRKGYANDTLYDPTVATPGYMRRSVETGSLYNSVDFKTGAFQASIRRNRILCLGAGYVGGPTMAMVAHKCPDIQVHVVDISTEIIAEWNSDKLPVYEPGLDKIVKETRGRNLFFSSNIAECIRDCDIIFIAVNTPTKTFGVGKGMAADLTAWEGACRTVAAHAETSKIVIEKSTIPVRTAENSYRILKANKKTATVQFVILSNPEFLAEGTAIRDLEYPDRVLIGAQDNHPISQFAISLLVDIYERWVPKQKVLTANLWSAELSKLVANAFLAQRVSSINTVSMLCEKTGADVREVAKAIGSDSRIGANYLSASVGFGGSCLQKDVLSLAYICDYYGLKEAAQYWKMVKDMNDLQKCRFSQRVIHGLFDTVNRKKIAVFGFAFKKNTSDTRSTPALDVCITLMNDGAFVHVYDPQVNEQSARQAFNDHGLDRDCSFDLEKQFHFEAIPKVAVTDAHAIIVMTEWDEFQTYNYSEFFELMVKPAFVFDGRNLLDHKKLAEIGFEVHGVGVPSCHGVPIC